MSAKYDHVREFIFEPSDLPVPAETWPRPQSESGIYFLWKDGVCLYIGQSRHLLARIGSHSSLGQVDFDEFSYVACDREMLDPYEAAYQMLMRPPANLNEAGVPKHHSMASLWRKTTIKGQP